MNKKYIAVALVMLLMVSVFAACKKDDLKPNEDVNGTNNAEISTDENGDRYVTNVDGDRIPVTTDEDGFYDDIKDLYTQTTTKKDTQNSTSGTTESQESSTNGTTSTTAKQDNSTTSTTASSGISIGNGNQGGSIKWDDIPAATN
ncbi:MAG: hypothetical protein ACI4KI_01590 [Candidatus Fimenecus sp.]